MNQYVKLLADVSREMEQLSLRSSLTSQEDRRLTYLTSQAATYRSLLAAENGNGETRAKAAGQAEERAALRRILRTNGEYRTYAPMNTSTDASVIPQGFIRRIAEAQKASGPLYLGSPILTDVSGGETGPTKLVTLDDTTSVGYVLTENGAETQENPALLKNVTSTLTRFGSGMVNYSMELSVDAFEQIEKALGNALGQRLGRIQNSTFLASLMTSLEANSSAAVDTETAGVISYSDVVSLVSSVNAAYRQSSSAGFLLSSATALALSKIEAATSGLPIFRHVLDAKPSIFNFPVYISDYADSIATGNKPIIFGDFSTLCVRGTEMLITVLTERYIDVGQYAVMAHVRADLQNTIQSTSDAALKYLSIS
jgi:HK97 family phage major capsid protein